MRNASGRSQATVNAQMPPELAPPIARWSGSVGEVVLLADLGQDLVDQEARVVVAERVVLEAAVVAAPLVLRVRLAEMSRVDEDADRHRHLLLVDQVVEHHRHAVLGVEVHVLVAVLKHHHRGRRGGVVLRGDVDPVVPDRAGKHLAAIEERPLDAPFGHARLHLRIGTQRVGFRRRRGRLLSGERENRMAAATALIMAADCNRVGFQIRIHRFSGSVPGSRVHGSGFTFAPWPSRPS